MYAIVATGGKQVKVEKGQTVDIERVAEPGSTIDLKPVMLVDGDTVLVKPSELAKVSVSAKVLEEFKGKKIEGFTYKNKSNNRRRFGHRQIFSKVEITKITKSGAAKTTKTEEKSETKVAAKPAAKKPAAKKPAAAAKKPAAAAKKTTKKVEE